VDVAFKVIPQAIAIVFLLASESSELFVDSLVTRKIDTWGDEALKNERYRVLAFVRATLDFSAAFGEWISTVAAVAVLALASESDYWQFTFTSLVLVWLVVGVIGLTLFLHNANLGAYLLQAEEGRRKLFQPPLRSTPRHVYLARLFLGAVSLLLLAGSLILT
jgi:hypothetical protein